MASKEMISHGEQQRERILSYIRTYIDFYGYGPSIKEIGDHVGISSPNAVRSHLEKLQDQGLIRMTPRIPRSVRPVPGQRRAVPE